MRGLLEDGSFNQSPPFIDRNLFTDDGPLTDAAGRFGLDAHALSRCGVVYGSEHVLDLGRLANENPPKLRVMDAKGHRADRVEFHPAYHELMTTSVGFGIHSSVHDGSEPAMPMTARAVRLYLATQAESGHLCPITMTHASVGALSAAPDILAEWRPKIVSRSYDPAFKPWREKAGVTIGMGMTERQGGTDVRANITHATGAGDTVEITGHKWFMSAPMCDAFLVLAQAEGTGGPGGLSCYLMPRHRPDGRVNGLRFARLKDKLGNKSNASSEVEFHRAWAQRVGDEGTGVRTIIEMVQLTRLDCIVASAGQQRIALAQALHHVRHRSVFQRRLSDQPAMRAVIADLALEMEAQVALTFRLAAAFDRAASDTGEAAYARLMTPAVKFLVCKSVPGFVYEALECCGGNGYTEDLPMARYYREAPLNAIWEGSGNVMALDVLRAAGRDRDASLATLERVIRTASVAYDCGPLARVLLRVIGSGEAEARARFVCETLARFAAVAALVEAGSPFAADYARTRLGEERGASYGFGDIPGATQTALTDRALAA